MMKGFYCLILFFAIAPRPISKDLQLFIQSHFIEGLEVVQHKGYHYVRAKTSTLREINRVRQQRSKWLPYLSMSFTESQLPFTTKIKHKDFKVTFLYLFLIGKSKYTDSWQNKNTSDNIDASISSTLSPLSTLSLSCERCGKSCLIKNTSISLDNWKEVKNVLIPQFGSIECDQTRQSIEESSNFHFKQNNGKNDEGNSKPQQDSTNNTSLESQKRDDVEQLKFLVCQFMITGLGIALLVICNWNIQRKSSKVWDV